MERLAAVVLGVQLLACSEPATAEAPPVGAAKVGDGGTRDAQTDTGAPRQHVVPASLDRCAKQQRAIDGIVEAVSHLNGLTPAGGPCFVASLPRPLAVVATSGTISAQPAEGPRSPRLFFLLPKLVVGAVPSGRGSALLEFGEWVTKTRTLKGEIALPVTAALPTDAAFAHVRLPNGEESVCRTCHRNEEPHGTIAGAYVSEAFKPEPGTFVPLDKLANLHDECSQAQDTSDRCAMFHALFDFGDVKGGEFEPEVGTFLFK
jgi:hypothetical protein